MPTVILVPRKVTVDSGVYQEVEFIAGQGVTITPGNSSPGRHVSLTLSAAGGGGTPASTVTSETSYGISPAVGVGTDYARADHTHGSPTAPTAASVGADASGTASAAVSAHVAAGDPHPQYAIEADLGGAAFLDVGTVANTVAAGDDSRIVGAIQASVLTTNEDILIRRAGVPARLPVGAEGSIPRVVGGVVVWTALTLGLGLTGDPYMAPVAQQGSPGRTT